jgi:Stress responsive A/B Barrel Domain
MIFAAIAASAALAGAAHAAKPARGRLYHVVSFKFKDTATKEDIRKVEDAFHALKAKIPLIERLSWGTNTSPEKLNKGFTHCWVLVFRSEKDRDAYLVHPDHKAFGQLIGPYIGDVFVIDFQARD